MIDRLSHGSAWRRYGAVVALTAMLVRAFIPVGWMPTADARAEGVQIVICTSMGVMQVLDEAGGPPSEQPQKDTGAQHQTPCAFAGLASLATPAAQALFIAPQPARMVGPAPRVAHFASSDSTPWHSRAPPSFAPPI